ncbi:MAG TPA: hypothetical protein VED01_02940 [Burkholderiales bacterium]|nr:hypothetical protein [Burkholderiales bacterium]
MKALRNASCAIFLFAASTCWAQPVLSPAPKPPSGARTTVFISDLHLGLGRVAKDPVTGTWSVGGWHPMEDFRWHANLDAFLSELEARSRRTKTPTDLVILGDFLELWQTPWADRDCIYDKSGKPLTAGAEDAKNSQLNLSCAEADALRRLTRVLGAHEQTLKRLGKYAMSGDNRLFIVPGNHDAALVYPKVAGEVLKKIGASAGRVRIAVEGYWLSADGLIIGEHGHLWKDDVNAYARLPASCLDVSGKDVKCDSGNPGTFLLRPWGEQFVQSYYNKYEEQFSIVDNLSNELYGAKLAMREAGLAVTLDAIAKGFQFLLFGQSWDQFAALLGDKDDQMLGAGGGAPDWDLKAIRKQGDSFLVESLPRTDPIRPAAEKAVAEGKLGLRLATLDDAQIRELCDLRAALYEAARTKSQPAPVDLCPGQRSLGAIKSALMTTVAQRMKHRVDQLRASLPATGRPNKDFSVYVYGHTHSAHNVCKPVQALSAKLPSDAWNPAVINSGAWQRVISQRLFEEWQQDAKKKNKPLSAYTPEDLPECYSMVVIPSYQQDPKAKPEPQLLFWARDPETKTWDFLDICPQDSLRAAGNPCGS